MNGSSCVLLIKRLQMTEEASLGHRSYVLYLKKIFLQDLAWNTDTMVLCNSLCNFLYILVLPLSYYVILDNIVSKPEHLRGK